MSYTYGLLIDENRHLGDLKLPEEDGVCWHSARTLGEAKAIILRRGMPKHISVNPNQGVNVKNGQKNIDTFMNWLHTDFLDKNPEIIPNILFH